MLNDLIDKPVVSYIQLRDCAAKPKTPCLHPDYNVSQSKASYSAYVLATLIAGYLIRL